MNIDITAPNKNGFINIIEVANGRWDTDQPDSLASLVQYVFAKMKAGVITKTQADGIIYCPEPLTNTQPVVYVYKTKVVKTKTGKFFPRRYILVKNAGGSTSSRSLL